MKESRLDKNVKLVSFPNEQQHGFTECLLNEM